MFQIIFSIRGKRILKFCEGKEMLGTYLEERRNGDLFSDDIFLRPFLDNPYGNWI